MQITLYRSELKKMLTKTFLLIIIGLAFLSCEKPPDYSLTPYIEFNQITKSIVFDEDLRVNKDLVTISLKFEDGDGDLGVSSTDIDNIKYRSYSDTSVSTDGDTSYKFINYRAEIFRKVAGVYRSAPSNLRLGGTFAELINYNEIGPIDGVLDYDFSIPLGGGLQKNDTIRFEVYIIDRELNISNTVTTDSIVVNQN